METRSNFFSDLTKQNIFRQKTPKVYINDQQTDDIMIDNIASRVLNKFNQNTIKNIKIEKRMK